MQKLVLFFVLAISTKTAVPTIKDWGWAVQLLPPTFNIYNNNTNGSLCLPTTSIKLGNYKNISNITKEMFGDCTLTSLKINQTIKWTFQRDAFSTLKPARQSDGLKLILMGADISELTKDTVEFPSAMTDVDVCCSKSLTRVDLSVFDGLESLENIVLMANGIDTIDGHFSSGALSKVKTLDLSNNPLMKEFPWHLLKDLSNLERVRLDHTNVENFDADEIAANVPKLIELTFSSLGAQACQGERKLESDLRNKLKPGWNVQVYCG